MKKGSHFTNEQKQHLKDSWARRRALGIPGHRLGIKHTPESIELISRRTKERTARGPAHYAWKGGSKQKKFGDRAKPEFIAFRKAVLERDGYCCVMCSSMGIFEEQPLEVHHIKSWSKHPASRFDPNNGDTLCRYHHQSEVHGGRDDRNSLV